MRSLAIYANKFKVILAVFSSFHGQRSVTAAWATRSPWSILDISSSYAKILGETNFQPRKFPQSGSKAKDGEKIKRQGLQVAQAAVTERWP